MSFNQGFGGVIYNEVQKYKGVGGIPSPCMAPFVNHYIELVVGQRKLDLGGVHVCSG